MSQYVKIPPSLLLVSAIAHGQIERESIPDYMLEEAIEDVKAEIAHARKALKEMEMCLVTVQNGSS